MANFLDKNKFKIDPQDENTYEKYEPRNLLAELVNPYLDKVGIGIPKVSVADRKKYINDITDPENAVLSMGMGSIGSASLKVKPFSEDLAKRVSDAFKNMEHNPNDPSVKSAYKKLIEEVSTQYDDLVSGGLKVDKIQGENPYKTSKDLVNSVKSTNEMKYFPTEQGFGSGAILDNPLLQKTGRFNGSGDEMLANDLFRVVHDYHGHVKPQSSFGPKGEEIAYQSHKAMFSPEAQKALATETRGQNSFVNFGDNAINNKLDPKNTVFAEQKIGLLPDWAVNENAADTVVNTGLTSFTGLANALKLKKDNN